MSDVRRYTTDADNATWTRQSKTESQRGQPERRNKGTAYASVMKIIVINKSFVIFNYCIFDEHMSILFLKVNALPDYTAINLSRWCYIHWAHKCSIFCSWLSCQPTQEDVINGSLDMTSRLSCLNALVVSRQASTLYSCLAYIIYLWPLEVRQEWDMLAHQLFFLGYAKPRNRTDLAQIEGSWSYILHF